MKIILSQREIQKGIKEIREWYGIVATPRHMKRLAKNPQNAIYIADSPFSTSAREELVSVIALDIVGEEWPTGAISKKDSTKFFKALRRKVGQKGYKIEDGCEY